MLVFRGVAMILFLGGVGSSDKISSKVAKTFRFEAVTFRKTYSTKTFENFENSY